MEDLFGTRIPSEVRMRGVGNGVTSWPKCIVTLSPILDLYTYHRFEYYY